MFNIRKITGNSMLPVLAPNDFVITLRCKPKIGDIIVVEHFEYGEIIKRVSSIDCLGYKLSSDNQQSIKSDKIGTIPFNKVLGKVIFSF